MVAVKAASLRILSEHRLGRVFKGRQDVLAFQVGILGLDLFGVMPAPRNPRTSFTVVRMPRTVGCPLRMLGSALMRCRHVEVMEDRPESADSGSSALPMPGSVVGCCATAARSRQTSDTSTAMSSTASR